MKERTSALTLGTRGSPQCTGQQGAWERSQVGKGGEYLEGYLWDWSAMRDWRNEDTMNTEDLSWECLVTWIRKRVWVWRSQTREEIRIAVWGKVVNEEQGKNIQQAEWVPKFYSVYLWPGWCVQIALNCGLELEISASLWVHCRKAKCCPLFKVLLYSSELRICMWVNKAEWQFGQVREL